MDSRDWIGPDCVVDPPPQGLSEVAHVFGYRGGGAMIEQVTQVTQIAYILQTARPSDILGAISRPEEDHLR
jgi:hypothetical protein